MVEFELYPALTDARLDQNARCAAAGASVVFSSYRRQGRAGRGARYVTRHQLLGQLQYSKPVTVTAVLKDSAGPSRRDGWAEQLRMTAAAEAAVCGAEGTMTPSIRAYIWRLIQFPACWTDEQANTTTMTSEWPARQPIPALVCSVHCTALPTG